MFALLGFCAMTFLKSCSNSGVSTQMLCTTFQQTRGGALVATPHASSPASAMGELFVARVHAH